MTQLSLKPTVHRLTPYIERLQTGGALVPDSPQNVLEVVGILKSYGVVLEAYYQNLLYISEHQFLVLFPFFKYFNGDVTWGKLLRYLWHDRINFEYAEYCMRTMMWHGGGGLDAYLDSEDFKAHCDRVIQAKIKHNPLLQGLHRVFSEFLPDQVRQMVYYNALGQFWDVMSEIFLTLSDLYDAGKIQTIPQVVEHILAGLVAAASNPITYAVSIDNMQYDIIPASAQITFLMDVAVPYVEAVFFRGTPFLGTVSYNAQARQISPDQFQFTYGALYADPLPIGGAGIPPTLLMQDMRHFLPDYLHQIYQNSPRGEDDLRVKICETFQKSMFCVTTAALMGLAPHPLTSTDPEHVKANQTYLEYWMDRFLTSRLQVLQSN
jgi:CO2 hydration protein